MPIYLAAERTTSVAGGVAAAVFYAAAPFGWFWLVQGGGLTRSLAMLLALTALLFALRGRPLLVGVAGGLTALTHPETAIFAAVCCAAVLAVARAWRSLMLAGAVSMLIVLPWFALVVSRHGFDPFIAAAGARAVNPVVAVLSITSGRPGMLDLAAAIGLVGSRLSRALALRRIGRDGAAADDEHRNTPGPLAAIGVGATIPAPVSNARSLPRRPSSCSIGSAITIGNPEPLGSDDHAAMGWARSSTPVDSRFVVLSSEIWSRSDEAEWFPYLADRVSVTTMQGREWLPDWRLLEQERERLAGCQDRGCVDAWLNQHDTDYVYLADGCCPSLAVLLRCGGLRAWVCPHRQAVISEARR